MARTKTIPDEELLDRLQPVLKAGGPGGLSFARAGAAVGLAPATLVQRFRSREGMVEAVLLRSWDRLDADTDALDATLPPTVDGAVDLLVGLTEDTVEGATWNLADGLLLLREDFRNPVLRARGAAWGRRLAAALGRRLSADDAHASRLGWQMASLWQGSLIWWGFAGTGDPKAVVRRSLEAWIGDVLPARGRPSRAPPHRHRPAR